MQKATKTLLDNFIYVAIFITTLIAYLSLMKISKEGESIFFSFKNADKIFHATAYFTLALSWFLTVKSSNTRVKSKLLIILGCIFYGIIIEVLQMTLTSFRTADYLDVIANSVGVLLALLIFNIISKKNEII